MVRLFLLPLLLIFSPAFADRDTLPTILIVGDSLSAGYGLELEQTWVALLQQRLAEQGYEHRVINASVSGDTTSGGKARLPRALKKHRPDLVVIELGGNDGLRGLPLGVVRENFVAMIEASGTTGADTVLLGMRIPPNYGMRYTNGFESLYSDLATQYDLQLIDFFLDGVALDENLMQADGIHPNAAGQTKMLANAWPAIETALRSRQDQHLSR